jgi:hypothetical protein
MAASLFPALTEETIRRHYQLEHVLSRTLTLDRVIDSEILRRVSRGFTRAAEQTGGRLVATATFVIEIKPPPPRQTMDQAPRVIGAKKSRMGIEQRGGTRTRMMKSAIASSGVPKIRKKRVRFPPPCILICTTLFGLIGRVIFSLLLPLFLFFFFFFFLFFYEKLRDPFSFRSSFAPTCRQSVQNSQLARGFTTTPPSPLPILRDSIARTCKGSDG